MTVDWSASPKTRLSVSGTSLEYACYGPPPDRSATIVMLHEGLGCVARWRDFPKAVAERTGLGVFVYSRRGYGQSDPADLPKPLDFMAREAVDTLPEILDAIGFQRGVLLGHSDGATISAIYAGSVQDHRVRGLILMAPHFFTEPMGLQEIARTRDSFDTTDLADRMKKFHQDPVGAFRGWADTWLDPGFRAWNVSEVIDYLRVPVMVIQGREDQYGTLAQVEEVQERSYAPVDVMILENCRHAPHQDQPERTLDAIAEFVERLERIEAAEVVPV